MNRVVSEMQTTNITDSRNFINATAIYIARQVGLEIGGCKGKGSKEPQWKRRRKDSIEELRRHVNILERYKQGQLKRKEKCTKKAPSPDGVKGYWIKNLTALHEQMADHIDNLINNMVIILV